MDIETLKDSIWLLYTAGFITSFINYKVEEWTGENPVLVNLQLKTIFIRKKGEKKILVKNTSEHLKEEVGTIISITSEDNQV